MLWAHAVLLPKGFELPAELHSNVGGSGDRLLAAENQRLCARGCRGRVGVQTALCRAACVCMHTQV